MRKTLLWYATTAEHIAGHLLHQNIIPNLRRIPRCFYVNQWKDCFLGTPALICGAGPSLEKVAPTLHQVQGHALVIGCGSALSALSHFGIRPHLGMAIDPNARELDCLKGCTYRDLPLLFASRLYHKVFELFDGPYGYIGCGTGGSLEDYMEQSLGLIEPYLGYDLGREALSVTTLAVSLSVAWGCNPIILAGVDLAYEQQKQYVEGVPIVQHFNEQETRAGEQRIRRKGAAGHFVSTLVKWVMERDTLDAYAKSHPHTSFFNANPGGLGFRHIPHIPLKTIASTHLPAPLNLEAQLHHLIQETKIQKTSYEVEAVFNRLRQSLQTCLELFYLLQHEKEGSGRSILYQEDLKPELAYQLLLGPAQRAFERVGPTKDPTSTYRESWNYLAASARCFLELI